LAIEQIPSIRSSISSKVRGNWSFSRLSISSYSRTKAVEIFNCQRSESSTVYSTPDVDIQAEISKEIIKLNKLEVESTKLSEEVNECMRALGVNI
jgi:hypothetical protein